ncbi:MAG: amino acid ABC transporter permease [Oscillospiraceae bacterium]|jgi:putative lysine transport system permease protein|nr:amino acid ABC transporter permease [Oscillospiraceae bacterium]
MDMSLLDWIIKLLREYWPQFLKGTWMTVLLAVFGTVAGFVIGLIIGVIRTIPKETGGRESFSVKSALLSFVNAFLAIYTEVFRGTPMMVQAMLIFYGLTETTGIDIAALPAGLIVISLNTGAYMAEIVRGGIHSVDPGQAEAAKAIGMNHWQTMVHVVLPQTIRNILPATGNEFVLNLKDSSVLNVITVGELFYATKLIRGLYYVTYPSFLIAAAIYLLLTFVSSRLLRLLEKRIDGSNVYALAQTGAEDLYKIRRSRRRR